MAVMQTDSEHIYVEFHERARTIFYNLFDGFEFSARSLNRENEEFKFRELRNTYINSLKQQLENTALSLLQKHQHYKQSNELDQSLQQFIKQYLHLFVQKITTI